MANINTNTSCDVIQVGNLTIHKGTDPQSGRVYSIYGLAATLSACGKTGATRSVDFGETIR